MAFKEFKKDMTRLKKACRHIDKVYEDSKKVFGQDCFESPWYEAMYRGFELAADLVAEKYDDNVSKWISWYIWENNWGKDKMEAGSDKEMFPIITFKDLWKIMKLES